MVAMLKFWGVLLFVRVARLVGNRVEIRRVGEFVHGSRQKNFSKSSLAESFEHSPHYRQEHLGPLEISAEELELMPLDHSVEFDLDEDSLYVNHTRSIQNTSDHVNNTRSIQNTSDLREATEILPKSLVSETFFTHAPSVQGESQVVLQSDLQTVVSRLASSLAKEFYALHEFLPTAAAGLIRLVSSVPKGFVSALPKKFSSLSELKLDGNPNGSDFGLEPANSTKADARKRFFEAAGLSPGDACKASGFFQGRGCALGCECGLFQHCDETPEDTNFFTVGVCVQSWACGALVVTALSCICCICALTAAGEENSGQEGDSKDDKTPSKKKAKGAAWFGAAGTEPATPLGALSRRMRKTAFTEGDGDSSQDSNEENRAKRSGPVHRFVNMFQKREQRQETPS